MSKLGFVMKINFVTISVALILLTVPLVTARIAFKPYPNSDFMKIDDLFKTFHAFGVHNLHFTSTFDSFELKSVPPLLELVNVCHQFSFGSLNWLLPQPGTFILKLAKNKNGKDNLSMATPLDIFLNLDVTYADGNEMVYLLNEMKSLHEAKELTQLSELASTSSSSLETMMISSSYHTLSLNDFRKKINKIRSNFKHFDANPSLLIRRELNIIPMNPRIKRESSNLINDEIFFNITWSAESCFITDFYKINVYSKTVDSVRRMISGIDSFNSQPLNPVQNLLLKAADNDVKSITGNYLNARLPPVFLDFDSNHLQSLLASPPSSLHHDQPDD